VLARLTGKQVGPASVATTRRPGSSPSKENENADYHRHPDPSTQAAQQTGPVHRRGRPPADVNPFFVVRITELKKTDFYSVRPIPSDWGTAYQMAKLPEESEPYGVCLAGADSTCDCKSHLRHGHCRHVEGLTALTNAGRL
jgi:hypothetical protein